MAAAGRYLAIQLTRALVTLFAVITFNFWLFRLLPGDYAQLILRAGIFNPPAIAALRKSLGLNLSLPAQYVRYVKDLVTFQWGTSYVAHEPVVQLVVPALVNTIILIAVAAVLTAVVGVVMGVIAGAHAGRLRTR